MAEEIEKVEVVRDPHHWECPECYGNFDEGGPCPDGCKEGGTPIPLIPKSSEFGAGLVVCLAKFSKHLWCWQYDSVQYALNWGKMNESQRAEKKREIERFPHGDAARHYGDIDRRSGIYGSVEAFVSSSIELWMNAASDHFYELDRDNAPEPLVALADLTLKIGHGFTGEVWDETHIFKIRDLWEKSCMALDDRLGVKPDWGNY